MSLSHHNPTDTSPNEDAAKLAHELANLLDGSLRNVGLAMRQLKPPAAGEVGSVGPAEVLDRLESASHAMRQMAQLVRGLMQPRSSLESLGSGMTVAAAVHHAVRLLSAATQEHRIHIEACVADSVSHLSGSELYTVVVNAMRNSIEAMRRMPDAAERSIRIDVRPDQDDLLLTIEDTGPGLDPRVVDRHGLLCVGLTTKPDGHGLGMKLCLDMVLRLDGMLRIANRDEGGARLTFRVPIERLADPDAIEQETA